MRNGVSVLVFPENKVGDRRTAALKRGGFLAVKSGAPSSRCHNRHKGYNEKGSLAIRPEDVFIAIGARYDKDIAEKICKMR